VAPIGFLTGRLKKVINFFGGKNLTGLKKEGHQLLWRMKGIFFSKTWPNEKFFGPL
jgi:hypothetical protein